MKRSSGVIIVDAENVSKELFQYAFSYIKHRKFCTSSDLYIFGNKQNIPLKYYNKYTHATFINTYRKRRKTPPFRAGDIRREN